VRSLYARSSEQEQLGFFRVFATPSGGAMREITLVRGSPIKVSSVVTQDPFTHTTAQLTFPQITVFDTPGEGDLDWLVPNCDIDIVFQNTGGYEIDWQWEGYIASYNLSLSGQNTGFTVDCKGALYALDDYVAIPAWPNRPIPYEILIAMAFDQDEHPCNLGRFRIMFPDWWDKRVKAFTDPDYLSALKPWGVRTGQLWTGMISRNTGAWEPLLSTYIQGLLSVMYTAGGAQWSIRNRGNRSPELYLRTVPNADNDRIVEIHLGAPGVDLSASRDWTQRAGVFYGVGQDEAGISFSGVEVAPDGKTTYYKPFAWNPQMYPRPKSANPNYNSRIRPKESQIQFESGLDQVAATAVAQAQYQRFSEPGLTGTITLKTDPRLSSGALMPRLLIQGGQTIRINGLLGVRGGVLAHVTSASADFDAMTTQLTFDTKYRDQLTVEQVQNRNRDALKPVHALQVEKYSNTIQDLIIPWSYASGSGIIPMPAKSFFTEFLAKHPNAQFPYEEFTTQCPPKNPSYKPWYIEIPPMDPADSNKNWSSVKRDGLATMAVPIRMSQAGTVRLSQIAAYDKNGHVMPVKFHVSVYTSNSVAVNSMPQFPVSRGDPDFPKYLPARKVTGEVIPTTYGVPKAGRPRPDMTHPFYRGGWEKNAPDGTLWPWSIDVSVPSSNTGFLVGWGNYYEPAGYWPGRFSKGASRTGLMQDDTTWSWQFGPDQIGMVKPLDNAKREYAGMVFIMIYCDDQFEESVYFMGRFIRVEPGQSQ